VPGTHRILPAAGAARLHGPNWPLIVVLLAGRPGMLAASGTTEGKVILGNLQRFFLAYSGVFALVALTAAVMAGLIATDRLVVRPAGRVVFQAVHRALSLAAVGFLVSHVLLEVLVHRSGAIDTVVPFLASGRTLYLGLGTLASDLLLLIVFTGVARRKFATHWTATWRALHVTAYLGWPLAILHGLLSGRPAKPYADWSYGACVAAVALALVIRLVARTHSPTDVVTHPVPDRAEYGSPATPFSADQTSAWLPVHPPPRRALPGGTHHGTTQYGTYGTSQHGVVDDGRPRVSGTS
jgi:DMSO/TMAO reductase YedYZ heme-binding membrane subunit